MENREIKVLVVEDEVSHAALIQRAFDAHIGRWRVDFVNRLEKARKYIIASPPDLAIVDLILPDGKGIDLLKDAAEEQVYPIVVLTGHGDEQTAVDAMKSGAFDYLAKSERSITVLPFIATRVLREWGLVFDRKAAEKSLKESEERYRSLVEDIPFMICRYIPTGELTFVNSQFSQSHSKSEKELVGHSLFDLLTEDCAKILRRNLSTLSPQSPVNTHEYPITLSSGDTCWQRWTVRARFDRDGNIVEYQSMGEDITERKQFERKLQKLATRDFLTGLPNRKLFLDRLNSALSKAKRYNQLLALLYLDLDGFKSVNDSFGHEIGDRVLQAVADRLQGCVREMDMIARLGGDEFSVIVEHPRSLQDLIAVITRIFGCFSRSYEINDLEVYLTTSIGVGIYPLDASDYNELIKQADSAMYLAKSKGKNQYHIPSYEKLHGRYLS